MRELVRRLPLVVAALAATVTLGACGGDDDGDDGGGAGGGKTGGSFTIAYQSQPDYLDPALSYTVDGWQAMWLVYTPPLAYDHLEGTAGSELKPGLVEELPTVSDDGKTYTFKFREGLEFSDGTPLKASDFEHTVKRILRLESGGAFYYEKIEGADDYVKDKDENADISGIETNDQTGEVTITLTEPDGTFNSVLALNFSGVVPSGTPFENLTKNPPPGVGPYKITKSVPNREFVLEKVAGFELPGFAPVKADKLTIRIVANQNRATQDVIQGRTDALLDPPAPGLLPQVRSRYKDRFREFTTQSTYYFFMNTREAPFDDEKVRQAVNFGIDKPALARLFGGGLFEPGCNFLPPGIPGYEKVDPCPWGDPNQPPDLERARQLIEEAGAEGAKVTVWGNNEDPTQKITEAYTEMLNQIGLDATPKIVDGGVYFQTIGNQDTKAQTGFANWFADFPHPANYMFLVNGSAIQDTNNQNFGNVDDPELTKEIDALNQEPEVEAVADRWAAVDRKLIERGWVAPYGQRKLAAFVSERVDFDNCVVIHPLYAQDFSQLCLK